MSLRKRIGIVYQQHKSSCWVLVGNIIEKKLTTANAIRQSGGLYKTLTKIYPNIGWREEQFSDNSKKSGQRMLFVLVKRIYPGLEV
jgi:hypothetical protein